MVGYLNSQSPEAFAEPMRGFRQGLKDTGYVDGENIAIEYRWAENQIDRVPGLAAELVRLRDGRIGGGVRLTAHDAILSYRLEECIPCAAAG